MATSTSKPYSSLAAALAQAPTLSKDRDAGHPAYSRSLPSKHRGGLLTPPNSLSPTLPPHKGRSPSLATASAPLHPVESDIDLHDSAEDGHHELSSAALSGIDAAGAITPALLAKHHLPEILLQNGPLAIRFVLGHLTQTVPGFARIPPAKARRLVVAALENRTGGGLNGDVVFEKVGWGRWDARYRDQPPREIPAGSLPDGTAYGASPSSFKSGSYGMHSAGPIRTARKVRSRSQMPHSPFLSPDDELEPVTEDEADKMSLDGHDNYPSPRQRSRIPIVQAPDDDDMTDEEDWANVGPRALREGSYAPSYASRSRRESSTGLNSARGMSVTSAGPNGQRSQTRNVSFPGFSAEVARSMSYSGGIIPFQRVYSSSLSTSIRMQGVPGQGGSPQEREAAEALLRMGSM